MVFRNLLRAAGVAALAALLLPAAALAGQWRPYDRAAFVRAQEADRTIFVSVHADW